MSFPQFTSEFHFFLNFLQNYWFFQFRDPNPKDKLKYGELLNLDLSYFSGQNEEVFQKRLETDENLKNCDEELKESHLEILSRFYKLFESIHRFVSDLNSFLQELDEGRFIQNSMETIFLDVDGRQLLVSFQSRLCFNTKTVAK